MKKRSIIYILAGCLTLALSIAIVAWGLLFRNNIHPDKGVAVVYIKTGSSYETVKDSLQAHLIIKNIRLFDFVARKKGYPHLIKPGKYVIKNRLSYLRLIDVLRSGQQTPVKVTFTNIRNLNELAGRISRQIEADSAEIITFLMDEENYRKDGFTKANVISLFMPDSYQFYWNTNPGGLYSRMKKEYSRFWNEERQNRAKDMNLSRIEVAILASIIDDEVAKVDEKPRIAGVYLNRLRRGMPLQACPTIKFALNDFSITRVLYKHLKVDSPYNTYKYKGFPPGPIGCPTIEGMEAVLNAEKHDYIFFAAKADFSGYHNFSRTLTEHNRYAAEYQKELDKRKIFK
jgi:UPF0755 protein